MTRAGQRNCFRCEEGGHFHANCRAPSDHAGVICNAKFYSLTLQTEKGSLETKAEEKIRKPEASKSTEKTSNNKEDGINHIGAAFLFNETTSDENIFCCKPSYGTLGHGITSHCFETS